MMKRTLNKAFFACAAFILFSFVFLQAPSFARTLKVGVGLSKPPYVIAETNSGMEFEIVKSALLLAGYDMDARYMPLLRILHEYNGGALDVAMHMRTHMSPDAYFSNTVITYQNFAITLKNKKLKIDKFSDLKNLSIVAFQNAKKFLGQEYAEVTANNKNYSEISNQSLQVKMLLAGRVQVVVADFRIFLHFMNELNKKRPQKMEVEFHRLFDGNPVRVAFRSSAVCDKFNIALAKLKETGEYDRILAKYISPDDIIRITGSGSF